jgi:hypothetical protein
VIRLRISTRTAATLLGMRFAAGPEGDARTDSAEGARPKWRSELERLEAAGEPTLSPYVELDEMLEARLRGVVSADRAPIETVGARCGFRKRGPQANLRRRGQCPRTRP